MLGGEPVRVAAIDCGTNSIRLLVADLSPADGRQRDLDRRMRIVRLGQDVDRTGVLAPDALQRTFEACEEYAEVCDRLGVRRLRCCATSAVRDAATSTELVAGVRERLGVPLEVISGLEEAALTADGALRGLDGLVLPAPILVVDIGGGSTELVVVGAEGNVRFAGSLDVGSVRLTERHLHDDPPTRAQISRAHAVVDRALDTVVEALRGIGTLVGVAGTITTLTAHALDLPAYDPDRIHGARIPLEVVLRSCAAVLGSTVERRRAMPFMHPGRADVIGGGVLVVERVVRRVQPTLVAPSLLVSEHDILDGIAWSLVAR